MGSNRKARGLVRELAGELDVVGRRVRKLLDEAEAIVAATGPEDEFRRVVAGLIEPLTAGDRAIAAACQAASELATIRSLKAEASATVNGGGELSVNFKLMLIATGIGGLRGRLALGPVARSVYVDEWTQHGYGSVPGDHLAFEKHLDEVFGLLGDAGAKCNELDDCLKDLDKIRF